MSSSRAAGYYSGALPTPNHPDNARRGTHANRFEHVSSPHRPAAGTHTARFRRAADAAANPLAHYQIIRRNGAVVPFEPNKIAIAMMKAFLAVHGTQGAASASVRETVDGLTQAVIRALVRSRPGGGTFHIEDVQDQVELGLMRGGHHEIARAYVLYRERRTQERAKQTVQEAPAGARRCTCSTAASASRWTWTT